jgi:hypothetical protein
MDARRFDAWTQQLPVNPLPRRLALQASAGVGLGVLATRLPLLADARKHHKKGKKRKKKLQFNAFGCVDVGKPCRGSDDNCCSGICEGTNGKKDHSRCAPHNVGVCQSGQDDCAGVQVACGKDALCLRTTGNASFCAGLGQCASCTRDPDCEPLFGPGAACSVCAGCETGTICNSAGA